jgi:hypothetical protein
MVSEEPSHLVPLSSPSLQSLSMTKQAQEFTRCKDVPGVMFGDHPRLGSLQVPARCQVTRAVGLANQYACKSRSHGCTKIH